MEELKENKIYKLNNLDCIYLGKDYSDKHKKNLEHFAIFNFKDNENPFIEIKGIQQTEFEIKENQIKYSFIYEIRKIPLQICGGKHYLFKELKKRYQKIKNAQIN